MIEIHESLMTTLEQYIDVLGLLIYHYSAPVNAQLTYPFDQARSWRLAKSLHNEQQDTGLPNKDEIEYDKETGSIVFGGWGTQPLLVRELSIKCLTQKP